MSNTNYYSLADLIGITIDKKGSQLTGKGCVVSDWGLASVSTPLAIFSAIFDKITLDCALLIAGPKDLGFFVAYNNDKKSVVLMVLDRSHIQSRGAGLFADNECETLEGATCAVMLTPKAVKAMFEGPVKGPFSKLG